MLFLESWNIHTEFCLSDNKMQKSVDYEKSA